MKSNNKHKHTHTAIVGSFHRELAKQLFQAMDAQELQGPEKVLPIWVKNLNSIANVMNNVKSLMFDMKLKDAIKLDIVRLDKSETCPEKNVLPGDDLYRYLYQPVEQHGDQKKAGHLLYQE